MESSTLRIQNAFGKTFRLTFILLLFLGGLGEWIARQDIFQSPLTAPKLGARHYQLGQKLALLEAAHKNRSVDCIAVGSSMIDVGFDPDAFQRGYQEVAGRGVRCFNFGIDASSAISAAALAGILIEDYHPRLLIFGTDPRDYAVTREEPEVAGVLESPWVRYRQGYYSPEGWLLDHSYLYMYRQHLSRLTRLELQDTLRSHTKMKHEILANGYTPIYTISTYINDPPDPADDSFEVNYYTHIYSSYQMLEENLAALERILEYSTSGTHVIVVEMPVSDGLSYFFGRGETDYNRYVTRVGKLAGQHKVPFWRTEPLDMIPDDGWSDYSHLNVSGAKIFSTWLGREAGRSQTE